MVTLNDIPNGVGADSAEDFQVELPEGTSFYEYNAYLVLQKYADFADAHSSDTLIVASAHPLGDAARRALEASAKALGFGEGVVGYVVTDAHDKVLLPAQLAEFIEGIDPVAVVVADMMTTSHLSSAYKESLKVNDENRVMGRTVIAFGDFEMMLADDDSKQRAWRLLKRLKD